MVAVFLVANRDLLEARRRLDEVPAEVSRNVKSKHDRIVCHTYVRIRFACFRAMSCGNKIRSLDDCQYLQIIYCTNALEQVCSQCCQVGMACRAPSSLESQTVLHMLARRTAVTFGDHVYWMYEDHVRACCIRFGTCQLSQQKGFDLIICHNRKVSTS